MEVGQLTTKQADATATCTGLTDTMRDPTCEATTKRRRTDATSEATSPHATTGEPTIISQGAEGIISKVAYLGRTAIRKERVAKRYRHPELDLKLRSRRLAQEARILLRLRKAGVPVPAVYEVDAHRGTVTMQLIPGTTLKTYLQSGNLDNASGVMRRTGQEVARMHRADVVHGDLTTSNIMVNAEGETDGETICLIDFGLSHGNGTEEDLAVDLYVFERAVISAHSDDANALNSAFLSAYDETLNRPDVMTRLADVRARGRKRDMTG